MESTITVPELVAAKGTRRLVMVTAAVDPDTLQPVATVARPVLLALAVHLGSRRLIDNLLTEAT